jgi:DNA polymerase-3 subunit alpha
VAEREFDGPYQSLEDFCTRMQGIDLNKRVMENLIKCGACDCFGLTRSQMLHIYEKVMDSVAESRKKNVDGQMGLFDLGGDTVPAHTIDVPDMEELSKQEKMSMEKEVTGLYLSGHPMDEYRALLRNSNVVPIAEIMECFETGGDDYADEQLVLIAGVVQQVKMKTTRNNTMMAYVTLEDDAGAMELLVFSNTINQYGAYLSENMTVVVAGKISVRDEKAPQLMCDFARPIDAATALPIADAPRGAENCTLYLRFPSLDCREMTQFKRIAYLFEGKGAVKMRIADTGKLLATTAELKPAFIDAMRELLGEENVVLK